MIKIGIVLIEGWDNDKAKGMGGNENMKQNMTEFEIQMYLENNYKLALQHPDPTIRKMALARLEDIQRNKRDMIKGKQVKLI